MSRCKSFLNHEWYFGDLNVFKTIMLLVAVSMILQTLPSFPLLAVIGSAYWELIESPIPLLYSPKVSLIETAHHSTLPTAHTHPGLTTSPGRATLGQPFYGHLLQRFGAGFSILEARRRHLLRFACLPPRQIGYMAMC